MLVEEKGLPTEGVTVVKISGAGFEVEIRGEDMGRAVEVMRSAFGSEAGVVFETEKLTPALEDPVVQDALASLTPGKVLRYRIENLGWSLTEVHERTGISAPNLSSMMAGRRSIGPKTAETLATALGCSATQFLTPRKRKSGLQLPS